MDRFDDMRARVSASSEETGGGGGVFAGFELNVKAETAIFKNDLVKCVKSEDYVGPKVYTYTLANTQTLFSRDYSVSASAFSNSGATITIRNEETGMYEPVTCTVSEEWSNNATFPTAYLSTLGDVMMGYNTSNQVFIIEIDKESRTADAYIIHKNNFNIDNLYYWSGSTGYPLYDETTTIYSISPINKDFVALGIKIDGKYSNSNGSETTATVYSTEVFKFSKSGLSHIMQARTPATSTTNTAGNASAIFLSDTEILLPITGGYRQKQYDKYIFDGSSFRYVGNLSASYGDRCNVLVFSHNFKYVVVGKYASSSDYSKGMDIYKINSDLSKTLIKSAYANYSNTYTSPSNVNITDDGRYFSYDSKIFTLPDLVQVASGNLGGAPLDDDYRCISGTTMKALISGDSDYIASRFDGLITDATSENIYGIATKTLSIGENGTVAGLFRTLFDINGKLQNKTITPSTETQTITADSGYIGLGTVTVTGDADLVAGNIRDGVDIFGVTGIVSSSGVSEDQVTVVEYIESTGTQYIDTGIKAKTGIRVVLDGQITTPGSDIYLYGARAGTASQRNDLMEYYNAGYRIYYYYSDNGYNGVAFGDIGVATQGRHTYETVDGKLVINGTTRIDVAGTDFETDLSMFIFCTNNNGTPKGYSYIKLYSCQIYDGDTLVRDFKPASAGGVYCLFDDVEKKIYLNAGTGSFTGA